MTLPSTSSKAMHRSSRLALAALAALLASCEDSRPKSLEDCLLQGLKGVTSDQAAKTITFACTQKFPRTATSSTSLGHDALAKLRIDFKPLGSSILKGSIYNGNPKLRLSTVNVVVRVSRGGPGTQELWSQEYKIDAFVPALQSAYLDIHLGREIGGGQIETYLVAATGTPE